MCVSWIAYFKCVSEKYVCLKCSERRVSLTCKENACLICESAKCVSQMCDRSKVGLKCVSGKYVSQTCQKKKQNVCLKACVSGKRVSQMWAGDMALMEERWISNWDHLDSRCNIYGISNVTCDSRRDIWDLRYSLLHLECHSMSVFNRSFVGLFSTKRSKRDLEN